ncbi:hypothetical protein O6H91_02G052800 [Diphasiastrum complanatum]|uniref:Uncharacterized protein n=2 Tax=Diphasiastrum complanatum TaxID=34168 RepID=A0ACC2EFR6_DIPCM|nr:hypothetical protein O6H91_Y377400 [Diphasiastrum complanatum]KAJ7565209.1 hypothetical protein O6H91_02G052800 [Diphasiastrum complanatum]KAJ7565210.1 hypothetical protein O6H91_02G052800 [Diphasiastrum complanatum]
MALSQTGWATIFFTIPGLISFALGILAENKKPGDDAIKLVQSSGLITCHYPHDSSIALGVVSILLLSVSTISALGALFFPYDGKAVPHSKLWKSKLFLVFLVLSLVLYFTSEGLLMWATITESNHRKYNTHHQALDACPTAKTGLFGGAAFLSLDTTLFWLICMILIANVRSEHFEEIEDEKGSYGQVTNEYGPAMAGHYASKV